MSYRASYRPYGGRVVCEAARFTSLANAEKVLLTLEDKIKACGNATVADFYELTGGLVIEDDSKYGWNELLGCRIEYTRYGYELIMTSPICLDNDPVREVRDMLTNCGEEDAYDTVIEARRRLSEVV